MKSYNICQGCGVKLQSSYKDALGYAPNPNSPICQKCFRAKNYGEFSNNLNSFYKIDEIKEIKNDNVIMIVDALNPYETLISNINNYVNKNDLTILINKVDVLPKSIPNEAIIDWIAEIADEKEIEFKQLALVSANKKINIDAISSFIINSDKNTSFIGYSNVGKSSIIKALFESIGESINNLVTNSIGTTKEIINMKFDNKIIKDYPGIILEGSYQNIMDIDQLKLTNPKKEIRVSNYQLNSFQTIDINEFAQFSIKEQSGNKGYQFTFSNLVKLNRSKYKENSKFESCILDHKKGNRYDLIISGLGIITFKSEGQVLELNLPKGVKYNLINSLYQ